MTATLTPLALLIAGTGAPLQEQVDLAWKVKEADSFKYEVTVNAETDMGTVIVVFDDVWKFGKNDAKGQSFSRCWLNTMMDVGGGEQVPSDDETIEFVLDKTSSFVDIRGDMDGMLIMLHPYFMFYSPEKPVEVGKTWERIATMKATGTDKKISSKAKIVSLKDLEGEKAAEVEIETVGMETDPITAKGTVIISLKTGMPISGKYEFANIHRDGMRVDGR